VFSEKIKVTIEVETTLEHFLGLNKAKDMAENLSVNEALDYIKGKMVADFSSSEGVDKVDVIFDILESK